MRTRVSELLQEFKDSRGYKPVAPTQEQIDRAEAVAMVALGDKINQRVDGNVITVACLAILLNIDWITEGENPDLPRAA